MRILTTIKLISFLIIVNSIYGIDKTVQAEKASLKEDFYDAFRLMGKGATLQFSETPSIFLATTGTIVLTAAIAQKKQLEEELREEEATSEETLISNLNILFSFPLIPLGTWYIAKRNNNNKLRMFALEYFSTLYLVKAEVLALSFIPINERPNSDGINAFEKYFRGKSSFPSGHMVPASTLFWKTLQYYGPLHASIPLAWTIVTGYQRVNSKRHHITDVIGTFFLSGLASEGVRVAAGHKNNHPLYKWIFEHQLSLNFFKNKDLWSTTINFAF